MSVAVGRMLRFFLIGLAGCGLILLVLWAAVVVPPLLLGVNQFRDIHDVQDPAKRLEEVNGLRTTLAGILGGMAVIAGAVVGGLNFREAQRQNRASQEQNRATLELQRRGQVTKRFSRAIDQLGQRGDDKLDVRIGAVYSLEQIARDSPELHWPIMEVLTAHLRCYSRYAEAVAAVAATASSEAVPNRAEIPADIQAIAIVIGRRRWSQDPTGQQLDLRETDLAGIDWSGAHLGRARLERANLVGALLTGADLHQAHLLLAHLEKANLTAAHLERAYLVGAHLVGANLGGAHLDLANLAAAHLDDAYLGGTRLGGAELGGAHGLTWEQLETAVDVALARQLPGDLAAELIEGYTRSLASPSEPLAEAPGGEPIAK